MIGARIGRYTVDRSLARGGMAEVFLAKAAGPGGFQKSVVIKRILPSLVEDSRFVELFLNEARLAALLNHPNIVQVFDFGEDEGSYFIAMEYIQGESVRNALYHYRDSRLQFPIRAAAQIAIGICEGLHYAHELCDENGVSYNIVHRDVTPENILISSSGIPKIVDFGIAKATSNTSKTEAGTVKGKYAYMAPEQVRGTGTDRRLDVYAVGVCLYEMLAGKRPFDGEALRLLHAIIEGEVPPLSTVNPTVPKELAQIVATAMSVDPAQRFTDARRMGDALEDWLLATGRRVSAVELAQLVADVAKGRKSDRRGVDQTSGPKGVPGFPPEGVKAGLTSTAVQPSPPPIPATTLSDVERTPVEELASFASESETRLQAAPRVVAPAVPAPRPPVEAVEDPLPELPRRGHGLAIAIGAVIGLSTLAAGWFFVAQKASPPAPRPVAAVPTAEAPPTPSPAAAPAVAAAPPAAAPAEPTPPPTPPAPPAAPTPPPTAVAEAAAPPAAEAAAPEAAPARERHGGAAKASSSHSGYLTVRSSPWCDVYLDGSKIGVTPISRYELPAGRHAVRLKNETEGAERTLSVEVSGGKEAKEAVVFGRGTLDVRVQPWAHVFLDGKALGVTPLEPIKVLAGTHELRLVNRDLGKEETRRVAVREGGHELVKIFW